MFTVKNVSKIYSNGIVETKALDHVSFTIEEKEIVSIMGVSGSGKTTLLNILSTLDSLTDGEVLYGDVHLEKLSQDEASQFRLEKFGFVYQDFNLIPALNVYDNIMLPIAFAKKEVKAPFVEELIGTLGLEKHSMKMPFELSGGEKQRVAIARALMGQPEVVFADEPTGSLDRENGYKVIELLLECAKKFSQTVIYVTHDNTLAEKAERILCLEDGMIIDEK